MELAFYFHVYNRFFLGNLILISWVILLLCFLPTDKIRLSLLSPLFFFAKLCFGPCFLKKITSYPWYGQLTPHIGYGSILSRVVVNFSECFHYISTLNAIVYLLIISYRDLFIHDNGLMWNFYTFYLIGSFILFFWGKLAHLKSSR